MKIGDLYSSALTALQAHKTRSLLTMLGIIIGVGAVVLMTSVGKSMEGVILSQISSLGTKSMVIFPGSQEGGASQVSAGFDSLTFEDVEALKKLSTIRSISPIIFVTDNVKFGSEESQPPVVGTLSNFFANQSVKVERGRLIDENDEREARSVVVFGPDAATDIFGETDPINKKVKIGDRSFTVVGVLQEVGTQFFQNFDERIYIPLSVAKVMTGQRHLSYITLQATGDTDLALADVRSLLRQRHRITPGGDEDDDDFVTRSAAQASTILSTVSLSLTLFITVVASISLVVGGIGIMNITLVSVQERTREIGLRKALGAKRRDVLLQFLLEAIALTLLAGILGILAGIFGAWFLSLIVSRFLSTYAFALSWPAIAFALCMALLTGVVFGLSPARKAAKIDPITALRYE